MDDQPQTWVKTDGNKFLAYDKGDKNESSCAIHGRYEDGILYIDKVEYDVYYEYKEKS